MKNKVIKKALSFLLAAVFLVSCLPSLADALPYDLKIDDKGTINNETEKTPAQLNDGELYTHTSVTAAELPSTDFTVSMSALGQQYTKLVTSTQRFNIVFVLDVSGSMGSSNKLTNMVNAANSAFATLNVNDNKIGVVTFSYTPAVERNLSIKPVRLSQIYSTSYSGSTDNIYVRANGGTNIQGGFNAAFKMLDEENDPEAIPVIILLSDGAPTYYYSSITELKTTSDYSGNGSDTGTNEVGYSIMQAAYLKTQMESLQIYTIPFSIDSNDYKAAATLNPTSTNINQVSGLSSKITSIKNSLPSSVRNQIVTNYPNGSYSASNSTASLGEAMTSIITNLQYSKPIAEKTVSGVLSESSFITMTYNIETVYLLSGNTVQVSLGGVDYPFTRHGSVFTYDVPDYQASYNESMTRVSIELDGNALIWQVPAGVLPCNTPEGADQVLASPIRLIFTLAFNDSLENLEAGTYPISSSCTASFYPTPDNPYYYEKSDTVTQTIAENTYTTGTERVYFAATYPYPGHDNYGKSGYGLPTLTGFATGSSSGSVSFMANPQNITVTDYYDHNNDSKDILTVLYQQQEVEIEDVGIRTAHVSLTTTNTGSSAAYNVLSFDDGQNSFSDAAVTAVSSAGSGKYNITVAYDGGKRSVTFINVSVSQTNIYETAYATFFSSRYDDDNNQKNDIHIYQFKINDAVISSGFSITNITTHTSGFWFWTSYYYDISVLYNGVTYTFNNVEIDNSNLGYYFSDQMSYSRVIGTQYAASASEYYYYATGDQTIDVSNIVENFRFIYTAATDTLIIQTKSGSSWINYGVYAGGTGTVIQAIDDGYTVTSSSVSTVGGVPTKTVTIITATSTKLTRQSYTTTGRNGVILSSGIVTNTLTNSGYITLLGAITNQVLTITNAVIAAPGRSLPSGTQNFLFTLYTKKAGEDTFTSRTVTIAGTGSSSINVTSDMLYYIVPGIVDDYITGISSGTAGSESSPATVGNADSTISYSSVYAPVTLTPVAGSSVTAIADNDAQVSLYFTFTLTQDSTDISFNIRDLATNNASTFSRSIVTAEKYSTAIHSYVSSNYQSSGMTAGTYRLTLKLTNTQESKPAAYTVVFNRLNYTTGSETYRIDHRSDYANQKVKILLESPAGH